ncbi:MAG TPA: CPBP family intramembrane metalloprotease [Thiotrichaceae bacterium]|jgi:membrane protease YdiL (CAAX protease family)|nr:CPBP family intramembrane metalloprotease [Thiotrichaceae bacterium]HIM07557.1 CPBP family intramembrane metalloprotease [Gammaproteobacteria bacterium]
MRAIFVFFLFVVSAFLLGAVLAYPLKLLLDPVLALAFRKYLTYATLISGLIISGVYLQLYNLLSLKAFGYNGKAIKFFGNMRDGFIYGLSIMLIIEALLLLLGIHEIDATRSYTLQSVALLITKAVVVGLLIAFIEESIFRGALFTGLYKQTGAVIATFFSSLLYATVHFIRYRDLPADVDIGWLTGLTMIPEAFRRFYHWSIQDYFLTLFIFGVLLALLRLKHKSIAACIGVHAGIVMLIKISDYVTNRTHNSNFDYLVSQYNSTFGWISFMVIFIFTIFYFVKLQRKKLL